MKKLQTLFFVVIATLLMSSTLNAAFPKIPLLERWTGVNCGPCAQYNDNGYSEWIYSNHNVDKVAIIHYHLPWPSGPDPMYNYNVALSETRTNFYTSIGQQITGVPTVYFNGGEQQTTQPNNALLDNLLATEGAKMVPIKITPKLTITNGTAEVEVEVFSEEAMSNIKLQILILQLMVQYSSPPGSNGEKDFPFVARQAFPDMNGEAITLEAGETLKRTYSRSVATLPDSLLYVVAFVEETNTQHNIVQAGLSKSETQLYRPEIEVTQNKYYQKVAHNTDVTHNFNIKNPTAFPLVLTFSPVYTNNNNWNVSTTITQTMTIEPNETKVLEYTLSHSGDKPSSKLYGFDIIADVNQQIPDTIAITSKRLSVYYIDITNDAEYAYLSNMVSNDNITSNAFASTTYFQNELVDIPFLGWELFEGDILDDIKFVGLTVNSVFFLADVVNDGNIIIPKLYSLMENKNVKVFLSGTQQYYDLEQYKNSFPSQVSTVRSFLKASFGVDCTEYPYMLPMNNGQAYTPLNATAAADDPISNGVNITLNQAGPFSAYTDFYNVLEQNATPVYIANNRNIMVKYGKLPDQRRVISGFPLSCVPAIQRTTLTSNIVDWLFGGFAIEDGETNLTTKNGLTLATYPNPVVTTSNITISNSNDKETLSRIYLLDVTGQEIAQIFDGILNVGDNFFELSTKIPTGKYFLVAETLLGKTYMSIVVER